MFSAQERSNAKTAPAQRHQPSPLLAIQMLANQPSLMPSQGQGSYPKICYLPRWIRPCARWSFPLVARLFWQILLVSSASYQQSLSRRSNPPSKRLFRLISCFMSMMVPHLSYSKRLMMWYLFCVILASLMSALKLTLFMSSINQTSWMTKRAQPSTIILGLSSIPQRFIMKGLIYYVVR